MSADTDGEPKGTNTIQTSTSTAAAFMKKLYSGNSFFFSPASISVALAMAYEGAAGKTREQMSEVLFAGMEDVAEEHGKLLRDIGGEQSFFSKLASFVLPASYEMRAANRLYLHNEMKVEAPFLKTMNTNFGAGFELVNFKTKYDEVSKQVNSWVASCTNNKIKDLIAPGVLNEYTRLIIVNAIYFKGKWKYQFTKDRTKVDKFYVSSSEEKQVSMMNIKGTFGFARNDNYKMLRLRYTGDQVSMLILLPKDRHGLGEVMANLTGEAIAEAIEKTDYVCRAQNVIVKLPRFKLESQFALSKTLEDMNCGDMFNPEDADFTGITTDKDYLPLYVSNVIHKAFVEVNEEGTEAAAATAVVIGSMCCSGGDRAPPTVTFIADHPFLFFIVKEPGIVLFGGAVTSPQG